MEKSSLYYYDQIFVLCRGVISVYSKKRET